MIIIECSSISDLPIVAENILSLNNKKIAFSGELGSGKTTLIKELCRQLGYDGEVTSPTFTLINEYEGKEKIYHLDFYRLKNQEELFELGYEEIFYSDHYVYVEWPEKIADFLPENFLMIKINVEENNKKRIFNIDSR